MLSALLFIAINAVSYFLALKKGPYWGLFAYMNIYFNAPQEFLHWWAAYLPFTRWSLLTTGILFISLFIHRDKLSSHKLGSAKWAFIFFILSVIISSSNAINKSDASSYLYLILTYCIIIYILIRAIKTPQQLRYLFLAIIVFATNLSIDAYLYGRRINDRLEMIGSADAFGSNEFSLLLAAIIPLTLPFIKSGKLFEKLICFASLPFLINAFILTNSRGSTVAFILAILISVIVVADKKMRKSMYIILIVSTPLMIYLLDESFIDRFSTLFGAEQALVDDSSASHLSSGRTDIWGYGVQMAKDNPFGVGPNGFKQLARFYMPDSILTFHPGAKYGVRSAHNTYLQVLVEQGIAGLVLWVIMGASSLILLYKSYKLAGGLETDSEYWKYAVFALNIAFVSVLVGGMVNSRVYFEYFWWQIAFASVTVSLMNEMATGEVKNNNTHTAPKK